MKMNKKILTGCFLMMLGASSSGYAKNSYQKQTCDTDTILLIAEQLNLQGIEEGESNKNPWLISGVEGLKSAACKLNPQKKNLMYVALASNPVDTEYNELKYDFTIAVVNLKNKVVVSHYQSEILEDATLRVDEASLWIDTANYRLNENTRAFGVEIKSGYIPSCAEGGIGPIRSLYIEKDKEIHPILNDLTISTWRYLVEGPSRCNSQVDENIIPIIKEENFSISIADTMTNGFKDIIISGNISIKDIDGKEISKDSKLVKENLYKDESLKSYSYKVIYDGNKYPLQQ